MGSAYAKNCDSEEGGDGFFCKWTNKFNDARKQFDSAKKYYTAQKKKWSRITHLIMLLYRLYRLWANPAYGIKEGWQQREVIINKIDTLATDICKYLDKSESKFFGVKYGKKTCKYLDNWKQKRKEAEAAVTASEHGNDTQNLLCIPSLYIS